MRCAVEDVEQYLVGELLASVSRDQLPTGVWRYLSELWHVIALGQQKVVAE